MESKAFVPLSGTEMTSQPSNSSGSFSSPPIRASPSYGFDTETVRKKGVLEINGKSSSSSSSSSGASSDGGSENGGFVSGEEDFETASEPIMEDPDEEILEKGIGGEGIDSPFVGSSEFFVPKMVMPVARVSTDDDEEEGGDDVVGGPRARVLGGEEVTGETESIGVGADGSKRIGLDPGVENCEDEGKGVSVQMDSMEKPVVRELVEGSSIGGAAQWNSIEALGADNGDSTFETPKFDDRIKEDTFLGGGTDQVGPLIAEAAADNKPVATESVNVAREGDSVVDAIHVSVSGSGAAMVGDEGFRQNADGESDQVSPLIAEPADNKFLEEDGVKLTGGGDSVVEAMHTNFSGSGPTIVGDEEENKDSEIEGKETMVDDSVKLDNRFDQISGDLEEPVKSKSAGVDTDFDKSIKHVTNLNVETAELGEKTDVGGVEKDQELHVGAVVRDTVIVDNQDGTKGDACTDKSETAGLINNEEKQETETKLEADSEATRNEPITKIAADGVQFVYSGKEAVGNEDQAVENGAESTTENPTLESKQLENNLKHVTAQGAELESVVSGKSESPESADLSSVLNPAIKLDETSHHSDEDDEEGEIEGSVTDEESKGMVFEGSEAAKHFLEELEQVSGGGSHSGAESSRDHSQRIDGQIVSDSDEEVDTDEEGDGKELFDSAALAALLKAATSASSDSGSITITSPDGSRLFSVDRPAGLGSANRSLKPASRQNRSNLFTPSNLAIGGDSENTLSEEDKRKLEKIQLIRVKFLRLVQRLGHSPEDSIVGQVLYRLALLAGRQTGKDDLNFSLNILVLGKSGVGKSATINSIFGEQKALINAFEPATTTVREIIGTVDGVKIRVFDTPGLKSSFLEQGFTKKCPPDIVLYVDRLDAQTRDLNDLPLLRTITSSLGPSIWRSAIVTLTHGASAPPDGPSGAPLSYETYVSQRSHVVQQSIGQAVGDLRLMNPSLMNPVSLVENHPSCRKNRDGQKVLPNGQSWRPQLLLLSYSMKILSEASSLSKPQDPFDHRKLFGFRVRAPPLPYLLSWLLQSRTHPKLSAEQGGDNGDSDIDLDDLSDCEQEEDEDEYDQLPPFKPLRKSQIAKLSKEQRKAYFEEYDYRVKLLQKQQWREELKKMREIKKKGKVASDDYGYPGEDGDQEGGPAAVPVPLPDMVLPPSFDCDNPAYRYRFLEPTSQFLARPVLDTHGWDHDCGYDGVNLEQSLAILGQFPAAVSVQVTKDKKEFNIHLDSSASAKHGENGSTAGFSVTFLGENVATGFKVEDQFTLGKRLVLAGSTGTVRCQGDAAYGANLEVRLREADFPIGQDQSTLGLSLVKWRGDLALGANLQSQFSIGRSSKMAVRVGLNNKLSGQITVKTSSSEQLQIALVGIIPVVMGIYKAIWPGVSENYSVY
ncbi:hypothetical protein PVL29_008619 [Vitis rotundifolia]|uniref:AIG1-type G domain-containing protein n=1 Tax=Vitis rotundifolia TaxID=103349 RepID=A0AA38ZWA7_VITRO|nr:hypothetical protein PVL29_008619 [Vitis rotundifolia]